MLSIYYIVPSYKKKAQYFYKLLYSHIIYMNFLVKLLYNNICKFCRLKLVNMGDNSHLCNKEVLMRNYEVIMETRGAHSLHDS